MRIRSLLKELGEMDVYFSISTLLELCGIVSYNLAPDELALCLFDFSQMYDVKILEPDIDAGTSGRELFDGFLTKLYEEIRGKATLVDALILKEAKAHNIRPCPNIKTIVTWKKRHFERRKEIEALRPHEFNAVFKPKRS